MSTLTINGIDRWTLVDQQSLLIEDQLNARNICTFSLVDQAGTARPRVGEIVEITIDGTLRFAGTIDSFTERNVTSTFTNPHRRYRIRCVDFNQYCDRHIVAEVYENQEMIDIIRDVTIQHLYPDGILLDPANPDGPTIEYYAANYISVAQVFNELSEMTGYFWYIDYEKVLHIIDRTTMAAPYELTQSAPADLVETLEIERTRAQYRNMQYIRGGQAVTDLTIEETFKGDGETTTFVTSLPIAASPVVSVDTGSGFVIQTDGIRQVDTGYDWYWQDNSNQVSQDTGGTVLASAHTLKVVYYGYYPLIDAARLQSEVASRQAIEGGSGLYETVEYRDDITDAALSNARAEGLLALFGSIQTRITFSTELVGWQAGQLLTITRPEHDLDGLFIISEVSMEHDRLDTYRYQVKAVSGSLVENWVAFFQRLAQDNRRSTRRSNEVVNLLRLFYEDVTLAEVFATPSTPSSVLGEIVANEVIINDTLDKHYLGFTVIGDLLQTINYATPVDPTHLGLTESTPTISGHGIASDTTTAVLTETSTLATVSP